MRRRDPASNVRAYYARIRPFYEREPVASEALEFWRGLARERRPERILDLGAGTGRLTSVLAREAPTVGTDISLAMLRIAARRRSSGSRLQVVAADMCRAAFRAPFDLIVASSDPFCHLTHGRDRRRALRAAADLLSPRGVFVLEGLYRRPGAYEPPERRVRGAGGPFAIAETWHPLGGRAPLWRARYRYHDLRPEGRVIEAGFVARAWEPGSIRSVFATCGLSLEALWGDFDRRPFRPDALRLIALARRACI